MLEQWCDIEGFEEYYAVSNYGEVYNKRTRTLVAQRPHTNGHMRVSLYKEGKVYDRYVSVLVANAFFTAFSGNAKLTQVNGNPRDNRVTNLRLLGGTVAPDNRKRRAGWGRPVRIRETGQVFRTAGDCARYLGGDYSKVYAVLRGTRSHHLGYTFEWVNEGDRE